jgi:NAD dependent epimerase/dehydratase family enzyme
LRDTVAGLVWLVDHPELTGPVNLVGPQPERQRQVASELGRQLHRPALLPAPAFGIRAVLGGFADEVLTSKRVVPNALQDSGFRHTDATVGSAIHAALDG